MNLLTKRRLGFIAILVIGYILLRAIQEFYLSVPSAGPWLGKLTLNWMILFTGLCAFAFLTLVGIVIFIWFPERIVRARQIIINARERLQWLRWPLAILIALVPAVYFLYVDLGGIITGPYLRLLTLLVTGSLIALLTTTGEGHLMRQANFFLGITLVASIFYCAAFLTEVNNYPFSLSWSEGNRLYDYSISLGRDRYQYSGELRIPYNAPGRYLLWGILFAIPDTPIWLHRLWNAILFTLPYILLGYLLARWSALKSLLKWIIALWFFLFLSQGPIYTPLLLSAIVIVLTVRPRSLLLSLAGVVIAGYYASASRWTWLPAPATWAVLILLSDFEIDKNAKWYRNFIRLIPIGLVAAFGLLAGALANPKLFSPKQLTSNLAFVQPRLWYRLFPSSTYPEGILLGLLIAIGPLLAFLIWLIASKRWNPNWLRQLAYAGASLAFLAIGLTASVKIGGGNNLHNLDMLFVTLVLISGLMLRDQVNLSSKTWPILAQTLLILVVLIPAWQAVKLGSPLELPPEKTVDEALNLLNNKLSKAQRTGEILFIDQRQLLTFNYIKGITLVSDYEKKYMMDQAMAGNASYFKGFYQDLATGRFSMIVSEPLYTNIQDPSYSFQEENNAWVKWIAAPLLCYYAPVATLPEVRVQLLVPRANPGDCLPDELQTPGP
jgi:hypothetical protein